MKEFTVGSILGDAWGITKQHFGFLIGLSVVLLLASLLTNVIAAIPVVGFLAVCAVQIVIKMGALRTFLSLVRGEKRPYSDLFTLWKPFWVFLGASLVFGLIVSVGMVLLIIPGIMAAVALQFFVYEIVDGNKGAIEAIKSSAAMTKGKRLQLFWLMLTLGLINMLGALLFGVGLIITIPLSGVAMALAYEALKWPDVVKEIKNTPPVEEAAAAV